MLKRIAPSIAIYGSLLSAIFYDWSRPLLLKAWILLAILGCLYLAYKLFRPVSAEDLHREFVDHDNNSWSGDLEAHRRRRNAREAVYRREELLTKARISGSTPKADQSPGSEAEENSQPLESAINRP